MVFRRNGAQSRQRPLESIGRTDAAGAETSSLHLDIVNDFKRINSHICSIAHPILEQAGALAPTRLRDVSIAPVPSEPNPKRSRRTPPAHLTPGEGDINLSSRRRQCEAEQLSAETRALLERDERVSCINHFHAVLQRAGICAGHVDRDVEDGASGFHQQQRASSRLRHPKVIEAVKRQLDQSRFSPRRFTKCSGR